MYFTLDTSDDVDYVAFEGKAGQSILIGMTIPQIDGHEDFAPAIAVMGPGLSDEALPDRVQRPVDVGVQQISPLEGPG